MSLHKSLVAKNKLARRRNVLKRGERIDALKKLGELDESKSVFGLPKVKVRKIRKRAKIKKADAVAAAAAGVTAAPAPAAAVAAKPAKPAKKEK
ncbi:MAG: small basic protein [Planctomycetota bacterium]